MSSKFIRRPGAVIFQLHSSLAVSFFLESGSLAVKVVSFASCIDKPETIVLNVESEDQIEWGIQLPLLSVWSDRFSAGPFLDIRVCCSREICCRSQEAVTKRRYQATLKQFRALLGQ